MAPDVRVLAVAALDLTAIATLAFAAGVRLPIAVAAPVAVVVPFLWLAFVPAMYPVWLRHVTGMFRDCCELSQDLAAGPVLASAMLDFGLIVSGALILKMQGDRIRRPLMSGGAVLGASAIAAVMLVAGMPYAPVVARDPSALACQTAKAITVCVWPEHRALSSELESVLQRLHEGWSNADIAAPAVFTEADRSHAAVGAGVLQISANRFSSDAVIRSMTEGVLPAIPDCPGGATGFIAYEYLSAWYAAAAGMTTEGLRNRFAYDTDPFPAVLTVVEELMSATSEIRRDWVARAIQVSKGCDEWEPSDLAERLAVRR
jgi:hypothetical protein